MCRTGERAEAGGDAVGGALGGGEPLDVGPGGRDRLARRLGDLDLGAVAGDGLHVRTGQRLRTQLHRLLAYAHHNAPRPIRTTPKRVTVSASPDSSRRS